jgi:5-methylcytosine-specific restriction protein B
MPPQEHLYIITASNEDAKEHVRKSIANPIDPAICAAHFPNDVLDEVRRKSTDGNFYAWGARPGKRNEPNWNALQEGDFVFLYQDGIYTYWTRVISKHRNAGFAEAIWRRHPEGDTWEFMYFLQPSVPVRCPADSVSDLLPARYQGFTPISNERVQNIVSKYGSIDKFIEQRMMGSETYLMLRSNEESNWSDQEGRSYHYGNTVANHTAVVRGAKFLLDRVDRDGRRILGTGIIGERTEESGSGKATKTFRAAYEQYRPLRPPHILTDEEAQLLASLPGYNIQHSIHKITKEVFERLGKPATAWIFQANPEIYDLRSALQAVKVDTFLVTRYENEIKTGDRIYLWESGDNAGIVGIAEVIENPKSRPGQPEAVPFQRDRAKLEGIQVRALVRLLGRVDPVITRQYIKSLPAFSELSILKQPAGSNFRVTPAEAEAIEELLAHNVEPAKNARSEPTRVNESREVPKNLILYGPPGTGKTYHTVDKALEILDPQYLAQHKTREELKKRFDELASSGRIEFVTFHQSFAYEDFVEGIRAETTPDGQLRYDVKDGVFKDVCDRARRASAAGKDLGVNESPRIWKISIDGTGPSSTRDYCLNNGEARIGWGNVGDLRNLDEASEEFKKLGPNDQSTLRAFCEEIRAGDILLCIKSITEVQAVGVVQGEYEFIPSAPNSVKSHYLHVRRTNWFLKDLSLSLGSLNDGKGFTQKTVYELNRFNWNQLLDLLRRQNDIALPLMDREQTPKFVLIIDEINRGNVSRIFGELITLIEPSKREGAEEALAATLPYSKQHFGVPPNVYILGTMNTADRSLTGLDIALRRRFRFEEVLPEPDLLHGILVGELDIRALLMVLNERIEVMLDRDHCLGHSYFLPLRNDNSLERLATIFEQEIIPLLREYFFEDSERIRWVLNDHRKTADHQFLLKPKSDLKELIGDDAGMPTEARRLQLNTTAFTRLESFRGIIQAP